MRVSLALAGLAALALAGCGDANKSGPDGPDSTPTTSANSSEAVTYDVAEAGPLATTRDPGNAPPHISPDAAPDVAFGYRYNFGLPGDRIASVQQRHAALCEEMGVARCRITGMTYTGRDNDVRRGVGRDLRRGVAGAARHRGRAGFGDVVGRCFAGVGRGG